MSGCVYIFEISQLEARREIEKPVEDLISKLIKYIINYFTIMSFKLFIIIN